MKVEFSMDFSNFNLVGDIKNIPNKQLSVCLEGAEEKILYDLLEHIFQRFEHIGNTTDA